MAFQLNIDQCVGCGACAWVCLFSVPKQCKDGSSTYEISKDKCVGCAPLGEIKQPFEIDQQKCFQCGACAKKCRFGAIEVEYA